MKQYSDKLQINNFFYVPLILEILDLSFTKRSYLMTLCKRFILIWSERVRIKFYEKKIKLNWLNLLIIFITA